MEEKFVYSFKCFDKFTIIPQFDELPAAVGSETEFIFIRLCVLREYLEKELFMSGLPFKYDFEVPMSFSMSSVFQYMRI